MPGTQVFDNLKLKSMSADKPQYLALVGRLVADFADPASSSRLSRWKPS